MSALASVTTKFWARVFQRLPSRVQFDRLQESITNTQAHQRALFFQYRVMLEGGRVPSISEVGFRVYSQGDEDGILVFLFAAVGLGSRVCVDVCSGRPIGSNATNLICNWGFTGLLVDSDDGVTADARSFYSRHPDTAVYPPTCVSAWVTAENVNEILLSHGVEGEIDMLSIDLDGMDYWIWRALSVVRPRVVVLEIQDIWGPDASVTVPYDPQFRRPDASYNYCGASLAAMASLSESKGYKLIGTNSLGQNAFFVRADVCPATLRAATRAECFRNRSALATYAERRAQAMQRAWLSVQ
jgi:hypothetical protein